MPLPKLLGGLFNELRAKEGMNDGIKVGPNLSYYQTTFRMTSLLIYEYRYLANYSHNADNKRFDVRYFLKLNAFSKTCNLKLKDKQHLKTFFLKGTFFYKNI